MTAERDQLPSFDLDHLARAVGGDGELMKHFASAFIEATGVYVEDLSGTIQAEEGMEGAWYGAAHKLKGAASTVGAHRLAALCLEAEPLPPEGDRRSRVLAAIGEELANLSRIIEDWLAA